ncbi:MAG: DUF3106 domain-containing protein [Acidobacteria bacterium]|nr:DUF3106 domain-containing protein [Acidobacteriota bacterium]
MKYILLISWMAFPLFGQEPGGPGLQLIERLNRMSPAERQKMLNRMPADRRQILEKRINNLNSIRPEAREKLRKDYEYFQQLPPEKRDEARRTLKQIADLPDERRKLVRGAVHNLRQQPSELRDRRLASRAFEQRFNEDERKLIREALSVLPPKEEPSQQ